MNSSQLQCRILEITMRRSVVASDATATVEARLPVHHLPLEIIERILELVLRLPERPTAERVRASVDDYHSACVACRYFFLCGARTRLGVEVLLRNVRPVAVGPPRCFFNLYLAQERSAIMLRSLKAALRALVTHCASHHCRGARAAHNLQSRMHYAPPNDPLISATLNGRSPELQVAWRRRCHLLAVVVGPATEAAGAPHHPHHPHHPHPSAVVLHKEGFVRLWCGDRDRDRDRDREGGAGGGSSCSSGSGAPSELRVALAGLVHTTDTYTCRFLTATATHVAVAEVAPGGAGRIRIASQHEVFESHIDTDDDAFAGLWFSQTLLWALYHTHCGLKRLHLRAVDIAPPHVIRHCSFPDAALGDGLELMESSVSPRRLALLTHTPSHVRVLFTELETIAHTPPLVNYATVGDPIPIETPLVPNAVTLLPTQHHCDAVALFLQTRTGEAQCRVWARESLMQTFVPTANIRINDGLARHHAHGLRTSPTHSTASPCGRFVLYLMNSTHLLLPTPTASGLLVVDTVLSTSCFVSARCDAVPKRLYWDESGSLWIETEQGVLVLGWSAPATHR